MIIHSVWGKYSAFPLYSCWNRSTSSKTIASLSIIDRPQHAKTKANHPPPKKKKKGKKQSDSSKQTTPNSQNDGKKYNKNISCAMQYVACLTSHVLSTENSASESEFICECLTFACRRLTPWFHKFNKLALMSRLNRFKKESWNSTWFVYKWVWARLPAMSFLFKELRDTNKWNTGWVSCWQSNISSECGESTWSTSTSVSKQVVRSHIISRSGLRLLLWKSYSCGHT